MVEGEAAEVWDDFVSDINDAAGMPSSVEPLTGFLDPPRNDNRRRGLPSKNHTRVSAVDHLCRRWSAPLGALLGLR